MIAIVDVDNLNLDNENKYRWEIRDKSGIKKSEILYETDTRVVIYAKDIKKDFKNISIRCKSKKASFDDVRLLSSRKEIEIVDSFDKDYILRNIKKVLIDEEILISKRKIKNLEKEIEKIEKKIKVAEEKISSTVTTEANSETSSAIEIQKSGFEEEKNQKQKEIEVIKTKIEKLENL